MRRNGRRIVLALLTGGVGMSGASAGPQATCSKPVYLTFDTGHMGVAEWIAEVLRREQVKVTFFLANEPTHEAGVGSLEGRWAPWWRARAAEGHLLASHTHDHVYWRADLAPQHFRVRASAGPQAGVDQVWSEQHYCAELDRPAQVLGKTIGLSDVAKLFRAPGGRTSSRLLAAAQACGYLHVGWSPAGFLGDELSSTSHPNEALLRRALRDIRPGDILMAHLGIWSRQDPWAPTVLEPLIHGLKAKGYCFATLREHPAYRAHLMRRRPGVDEGANR